MSFLKGFNYFTKGERRGLIVLLFILLILTLYIFFYKSFVSSDLLSQEDYEKLKSELAEDSSLTHYEQPKRSFKNNKHRHANKQSSQKLRFEFDPNTVSVEELVSMGLSQKQAEGIEKYRAKGGRFKLKTDFKKMYTVSDWFYQSIEDYIVIENSSQIETNENNGDDNDLAREQDRVSLKKLDLNVATKDELIKIKGIGEKTADRILKFKDLLGGFHNISQLSEVYGITPENLERILPQLEINTINLIKIKVNRLEAPGLKKHPYVKTWDMANKIYNERKLNGNYSDEKDLVTRVQDESGYLSKLLPYLEYK